MKFSTYDACLNMNVVSKTFMDFPHDHKVTTIIPATQMLILSKYLLTEFTPCTLVSLSSF